MGKDTERPIRRHVWELIEASAGVLLIEIDRKGCVRRLNDAARNVLTKYALEKGTPLAEGLPPLGSGDPKELAERFAPARDAAACVVAFEVEEGVPNRFVFRARKMRSGLVLLGEPSPDETSRLGRETARLRAEAAVNTRLLSERTLEARRFSAELEEMTRQLERNARMDPLTALPNRREFLLRLRHEWERYKRYKRPYSLLLVGVDRLDELSEKHGLSAVEAALVMVSELLKGRLRSADHMARFGDDAFAVLLYETDGEKAASTAEMLRDRVAHRKIVLPSEAELAVTIGASAVVLADKHPEEVLRRATAALQQGRNEGEDRAVFMPADGEEDE